MNNIETLDNFYDLILSTVDIRKGLVQHCLKSETLQSQDVQLLKDALKALQSIPQEDGQYVVALDKSKIIKLDLTYEINELVKDIFFVEHGEDEFCKYLNSLHPKLDEEVQSCIDFLIDDPYTSFITDRDGTVNNYCGRYASSVQSVYNAVFLTRFARSRSKNSVILTSAPLDNIGLADISVSPKNVFTFAGSKGREYFNTKGKRCQFPVKEGKQKVLNELNEKLKTLTGQPKFHKYTLIGSGLQFKFGQTTIARQDITKSVPDAESLDFLKTVTQCVRSIDPKGENFRIEDTGLDMEIILTIDSEGSGAESKDFDKGDGIKFLNDDISLQMHEGVNLVCGDTNSDVPMVSKTMEINPDIRAVFVTEKQDLKDKVSAITDHCHFVSTPDVLVAALNKLLKTV